MSESGAIKVIEVIGVSQKGFEDAVDQAVRAAFVMPSAPLAAPVLTAGEVITLPASRRLRQAG